VVLGLLLAASAPAAADRPVNGAMVASVTVCDGCASDYRLRLLDPATGSVTKVDCRHHPCDWQVPTYLPSKREVAFTTDFGLGIADQDFKHVRFVPLRRRNTFNQLAWSPDGRRLLGEVETAPFRPDTLYMINVETGKLTSWHRGTDATWSTDGHIVWVDTHQHFHITTPDQRRTRRLGHLGGWEPTFSPDGRSIAYFCNDHSAKICVTRIAHPTHRPVGKPCYATFDPGRQLAWSPDGTQILCVSNKAGLLIDVRTGRTRPVPRFSWRLSDGGLTYSVAWEAR
jgi:hypothetical protein